MPVPLLVGGLIVFFGFFLAAGSRGFVRRTIA